MNAACAVNQRLPSRFHIALEGIACLANGCLCDEFPLALLIKVWLLSKFLQKRIEIGGLEAALLNRRVKHHRMAKGL